MYEYRNVKTGEIVVTSTKVSGGSWEPVEQDQEAPEGSGQEQKQEAQEGSGQEQKQEAQEGSGQEQETEQPKATRRKR